MQEILTIDDMAKLFRVHKETIRRWRDKGKFTSKRYGRNVYYDRWSAMVYFEECKPMIQKIDEKRKAKMERVSK